MKEIIHKDQSVISDDDYVEIKGSLKPDTITKLKVSGKQIVPKKVLTKKQLEFFKESN